MKKKVFLIAVAINCLVFEGCASSNERVDAAIKVLRKEARQQGYNESCIEIAYGTGILDISEEEYMEYRIAQSKYEENPNSENFKELYEVTQQLISKMP